MASAAGGRGDQVGVGRSAGWGEHNQGSGVEGEGALTS
jgi:hypothetical protein